jgi:hypothetical protein
MRNRPSYVEVLSGVEELGSISAYARILKVPRSTVDDWYRAALKYSTRFSKDDNGNYPRRSYLITAAQIDTEVHQGFLANLEKMAEIHEAEILVPTFTYNKKGSGHKGTGDADKKLISEWYDKSIRQYMMNDRVQLNDKIEVLGNLNILPTAVNPLSGYQSFTGSKSGVFPHPKITSESVATSPGKLTKFLFTSGVCTVPNYMQKNAGIKGEFHHQIGAVLVEIVDNKVFHHRHVLAEEDGSFYDLTDRYENGELTTGHRVASINWGDIHEAALDKGVLDASWYNRWDGSTNIPSLLDHLKPEHQFFHDLLDFKVRNHHNRHDSLWLSKVLNDTVREEVASAGYFLLESSREWCKSVVVSSNHDRAMDRWVREVNASEEPNLDNKIFLLRAQLLLHLAAKEGSKIHLFGDVCKSIIKKDTRRDISDIIFLSPDESYKVGGVENGMHGDKGINGSRGSIKAYAKIGTKCTIGHSHSSGIYEGVYQNGCSRELDADYAEGPSSWSHTHTIQYKNGKRTQVTLINGQYFKRKPEVADI